MELKLNTIHISTPHEEGFWYKFLTILETKVEDPTKQLSHKEKELLSFMLCGDSYKNHFRGDLRQAILKRFRMSESQLSQTRTKLKNKGWLDEMLVTSVVRSVQKEFRKMIQKGDTDNTIHLTFALKLKQP